jgi:ribosomal protein S18 acetylase RimI-like enzyme
MMPDRMGRPPYTFITGGAELLDEIEPLWLELRRHHAEMSPQWAAGLLAAQFDRRRAGLIEKAAGGMFIVLARAEADADADGKTIGYCVSTIDAERRGEVDSLLVTASHRRGGVAREMMEMTMRWFEQADVLSIAVEVMSGNDAAARLYERFGFRQRTVRLLLER